jgi:hypothetical protein
MSIVYNNEAPTLNFFPFFIFFLLSLVHIHRNSCKFIQFTNKKKIQKKINIQPAKTTSFSSFSSLLSHSTKFPRSNPLLTQQPPCLALQSLQRIQALGLQHSLGSYHTPLPQSALSFQSVSPFSALLDNPFFSVSPFKSNSLSFSLCYSESVVYVMVEGEFTSPVVA